MIPRMDQERWGHLDITSDVIRMLCTDIPLLIDAIYQKICDSKNGLGKRKILKFQIKMFCTNILCYQKKCTGGKGMGGDLEIYTSKCFVPIYYATREYAIPTMDWEMGERSLNFHIKIFSAYTY
jgi:hypothetical protein